MISKGSIKTKPIKFNGNFSSVAIVTANVAQQVFSPAANVRGAVINAADFIGWVSGAYYGMRLIAALTTPTSISDGISIPLARSPVQTVNYLTSGWLHAEINIPPGYGLYWISSQGEAGGHRSVLYTLL